MANHESTAPAPEAHPVPTDPWPIPPAVQAGRKRIFDIRSRLESNLHAIENYANMLIIASTSDGVTELHGFAISQISEDISKRVETIWDGDIADLMKMLPPELRDYWKFGAIEGEDSGDDDGNGDVEEADGDVAAKPAASLDRLIRANKFAWSELRAVCNEEEANLDEPSADWSAATAYEEKTLMDLCSYRCRDLDEVRMRADYLANMPDAKHRLDEFEFVEALLRSSSDATA